MQDIEFDEKINEMDIDESSSNEKVTHTLPDMSAFAPEDLKALENGKIKMFRSGKKA